ncbi:MAG: class I SAM-dependent methyltransferase [Croceivirga sp.]
MSVLLQKPQFQGITQKELAQQLEGKKKSSQKLPTWFGTQNIYYPNKLNIEQASSERSAAYKSQLVSGENLLDMTGGFGVDSYFFSKKVDRVWHCEKNKDLSEIAAHNFKVLEVTNILSSAQDGIEFLKETPRHFDWVYIDPSRRDSSQSRVFKLAECEPNTPQLLDTIFLKTNNLLLKASPLLDITQGISELTFVKEVHVVAVKNEVKELLFFLEKDFIGDVLIKTINLKGDKKETFEFFREEESSALSAIGAVEQYLYEPNAAILKAGAFRFVGKTYQLKKLHPNTHLYTSKVLKGFPGRILKVQDAVPYNKKAIRALGINKANITVRNFPESVADLRKKYRLKEGGETYLFFTTVADGKRIILRCIKVL